MVSSCFPGALHKYSGLSCYCEPLPYRVESFARLRFDAHTTRVDSENARDVFAHGIDVGPELRTFEQNCRINIYHLETAFARQPHHARKQLQTTRTTPLWIFIRKMNPNIAFTKRAQDRIRDRMTQRVRIRMPLSPTIGSNAHTAKHKLTPFNKPVRISANPDPDHIVVGHRLRG